MGELVSSVFDYAKLGSEGFALQREKLNLPELLLREAATAYTDAEEAAMEARLGARTITAPSRVTSSPRVFRSERRSSYLISISA